MTENIYFVSYIIYNTRFNANTPIEAVYFDIVYKPFVFDAVLTETSALVEIKSFLDLSLNLECYCKDRTFVK